MSHWSLNEKMTDQGDGEQQFDSEVIESSEPILDPYDPTKINVARESMSVFQAMRKIELHEIKLDPEFQRNLVWDQARKSRLIESILLRIPLPAFYLDAVEPDEWVVVDGLQRLSTLEEFCNKKTLRLAGLEFLGRQFEGRSFAELPRSSQRDIEETQLTIFIIRPETPPKVKFTIFRRLNTGGMVLTAQEVRHATFPGRAPSLLRELAGSEEFTSATYFSVSPKRMDDRECVLRHLAFRMTRFDNYTRPDLNDFLGSAMNTLNNATEQEIDRLKSEFKRAMALCHSVLGPYAFRKYYRPTRSRGPVNKALFESWSTAVLDYDEKMLRAHAEQVITELERALLGDGDYQKSLSLATGGVNPVKKRFHAAYQIIDRALQQ
jgi:hypothetical protein